jgi:hypothetical protein
MRVLVLVVILMSCGPQTEMPDSGTLKTYFIATDTDFDSFRGWERVTIAGNLASLQPDGGEPEHQSGQRTIYINQRPKPGATEFPVGTIVVKEMPDRILAMVKRGGTYNAKGLIGWEHFRIYFRPNQTAVVEWRGLGPANGEDYGPRGSSCNTCHGANKSSDGVLNAAFRLRNP